MLPSIIPALFKASGIAGLPRAAGITMLVASGSAFWLTLYGFSVGAARTKYAELAKKDGEKDTETRYALPNLYVDGNSKHARAFNCVQRSHQQAFETLPQLFLFTSAAATCYPLAAAANLGLWLVGRITWSAGYAASGGDAIKRYDHPLAYLIFAGLVSQFFLAIAAGGEIAGLWSGLRALVA